MMQNEATEPDIGSMPDLESSSDEYANRFSGKAGEWLLSRQSFFTKAHILAIQPQSILDVGGGHAQNIALIESLNLPLTITGSQQQCSRRVNRFRKSPDTQFQCMSLLNSNLDTASFQHVLSYRIVSHMENWQEFIQELCRVSSDAVTVDFAARRSVNYFSELAFKLKHGQENDTRRYHVLSESEVDRQFIKAGFSKEIRSPQFFFPMAIHRKLSKPAVSNFLEGVARLTGLLALFGSPIIVTYRRQVSHHATRQSKQNGQSA